MNKISSKQYIMAVIQRGDNTQTHDQSICFVSLSNTNTPVSKVDKEIFIQRLPQKVLLKVRLIFLVYGNSVQL